MLLNLSLLLRSSEPQTDPAARTFLLGMKLSLRSRKKHKTRSWNVPKNPTMSTVLANQFVRAEKVLTNTSVLSLFALKCAAGVQLEHKRLKICPNLHLKFQQSPQWQQTNKSEPTHREAAESRFDLVSTGTSPRPSAGMLASVAG